ncbi:remorin 4.1-like [Humulus lupulus]|uniref:remorin 4.1-like n=1 Tax=Humulus lupulus TaxID=3486 RepID=UPI002B41105C|nr:remorin 4.1-like [Humulus lupulus]
MLMSNIDHNNNQTASTSTTNHGTQQDHDRDHDHEDDEEQFRDIHALTPPHAPLPLPPGNRAGRRRDTAWETSSHRSSSTSLGSEIGALSENFTTMSREFSALVLAGSTIDGSQNDNDMGQTTGNNTAGNSTNNNNNSISNYLARIGEDEEEDTNPLAIVPDNYHNPVTSPSRRREVAPPSSVEISGDDRVVASVQLVKKEEVESKISAWQNAKVAKINNRFKREDAVINGWESEQVHKATSWMKKVERKLEEKRARALEKMQNDVAKARRKAEERRASAEAKRGTKVARVLEISNMMRAVGRAPVKRSFF